MVDNYQDDDDDDDGSTNEEQSLIEKEANKNELLSISRSGVRFRPPPRKLTSSYVDEHELEIRGSSSTKEPLDITYYQVQPGDTLQSVCLRYACSVNQVKRLNGLISDQDFYGLNKLKLPVGKLGLLKDILHQPDSSDSPDQRLGKPTRPKLVNCPGSALSITDNYKPNFKPLLSPAISHNRINECRNSGNCPIAGQEERDNVRGSSGFQHSHSFSTLSEFANNTTTNIDMLRTGSSQRLVLNKANFIKADIDDRVDVDDLIMAGHETMGRVFQDLDFHVEQVKMSARGYDQRAAELVNNIGEEKSHGVASINRESSSEESKIPHIFYCNENFGLNYKKLLALIFIVCVVVPFVYINQTSNVTKQV